MSQSRASYTLFHIPTFVGLTIRKLDGGNTFHTRPQYHPRTAFQCISHEKNESIYRETLYATSFFLFLQFCQFLHLKTSSCTSKFLVAITPNRAVSWIPEAYDGRATDIFVIRDSGFLDLLEPLDRVMADCAFKI